MVRKPAVLWAEDSPDDRLLIQTALEELGTPVDVAFAHDGLHLLAALAKERPDLVVLDLKMPRLGGLEALRRIRGAAATRALPVCIFSAGDLPDEVGQATTLGALRIEKKPIDFDDFTRAVGRLVELAVPVPRGKAR